MTPGPTLAMGSKEVFNVQVKKIYVELFQALSQELYVLLQFVRLRNTLPQIV